MLIKKHVCMEIDEFFCLLKNPGCQLIKRHVLVEEGNNLLNLRHE